MVHGLMEMHRDFLKEMANIGAGNASTLLSKLVGKEVNLTASAFDVGSPEDISQMASSSKELVVVYYASIEGELGGHVLLVFPRAHALLLLDLLQKRAQGTTEWISAEDQDTLTRICRSLATCYLDAINEFLNVRLQLGELKIFSVFGQTTTELIELILRRMKQVFYLKTELSVKSSDRGEIFLLLDESLSSFLVEKSAGVFAR